MAPSLPPSTAAELAQVLALQHVPALEDALLDLSDLRRCELTPEAARVARNIAWYMTTALHLLGTLPEREEVDSSAA